jgi:valyl-tRNA synthetase
MQLTTKLENKDFVDRAPKHVVEEIKTRLADTLSDIETYQEQLKSISKLLTK